MPEQDRPGPSDGAIRTTVLLALVVAPVHAGRHRKRRQSVLVRRPIELKPQPSRQVRRPSGKEVSPNNPPRRQRDPCHDAAASGGATGAVEDDDAIVLDVRREAKPLTRWWGDQSQRKARIPVAEKLVERHVVNDRDGDVLWRLNVASDGESIQVAMIALAQVADRLSIRGSAYCPFSRQTV